MRLKRSDIIIMALATGIIVANIYYCQPLIVLIAREFKIAPSVAGRVTWLTQAGYASGLLFLVPLGDRLERKKQIVFTAMAAILALSYASFSREFTTLCIASYVIGFCSVIPQLILPMAAHLADPEKRGRVIGTIMSGLLVGILLSRTVSGMVGGAFGWRAMYRIAAVISTVLVIVMIRRFPDSKPAFKGSYAGLMKSLFTVIKTQPMLREASAINALAFALFGGFWTTMVLLLSQAPFYLKSEQIGLFGIAGAMGAMAAPLIGRWSDNRDPRMNAGIGLLITLTGTIVLYFSATSIALLIAGILILDLGQQGVHVSNQMRVYALIPEARNRLNTVFMTSSFIGTACGSAVSLRLWEWKQWNGVCMGFFAMIISALVLYSINTFRMRQKL